MLEVADGEFRQFGYHVSVQKIAVHSVSCPMNDVLDRGFGER